MKERFPPAGEAAVAALEAKIGTRFPDEYRALLSQSDGGRFKTNSVKLDWVDDETVLNSVGGVANNSSHAILGDYELLRMMERIRRLCIPIADEPGGNRFLIGLEPENFGAVYFWDDEDEPEDGGDHFADFPNVHPIARSFEQFIVNLSE